MGDPLALGGALAAAALVGDAAYDAAAQERMATEAVAVAGGAGDPLTVAMAQRVLGQHALRRGDLARARAAFAAGLTITRSSRDTVGVAVALNNLGRVAARERDFAEAEARHREALALARDLGYGQQLLANTLTRLAEVALLRGDGGARDRVRACLAEWREFGDPAGTAAALEALAEAAAGGDAALAQRLAGPPPRCAARAARAPPS